MKKRILFFSIIGIIVSVLVILLIKGTPEPDKNKLNLKDAEFEINLYCHQFNESEIEYTKEGMNLFLYVVALKEDTKTIKLDDIDINLLNLDNLAKRIPELEENKKLCEDTFSQYVELSNNAVYKYYIVESSYNLEFKNLQYVNLILDNQTIKKEIGMYMTI